MSDTSKVTEVEVVVPHDTMLAMVAACVQDDTGTDMVLTPTNWTLGIWRQGDEGDRDLTVGFRCTLKRRADG